MVCGRRFGSLDKLLKLAPEYVVHLQSPSDFFRYVSTTCPPRVKVRFLQEKNVRICACEEIYDPLQLLTAVDVPVNNAQGSGRPKHALERREVAGDDFLHCDIHTVAAKAS